MDDFEDDLSWIDWDDLDKLQDEPVAKKTKRDSFQLSPPSPHAKPKISNGMKDVANSFSKNVCNVTSIQKKLERFVRPLPCEQPAPSNPVLAIASTSFASSIGKMAITSGKETKKAKDVQKPNAMPNVSSVPNFLRSYDRDVQLDLDLLDWNDLRSSQERITKACDNSSARLTCSTVTDERVNKEVFDVDKICHSLALDEPGCSVNQNNSPSEKSNHKVGSKHLKQFGYVGRNKHEVSPCSEFEGHKENSYEIKRQSLENIPSKYLAKENISPSLCNTPSDEASMLNNITSDEDNECSKKRRLPGPAGLINLPCRTNDLNIPINVCENRESNPPNQSNKTEEIQGCDNIWLMMEKKLSVNISTFTLLQKFTIARLLRKAKLKQLPDGKVPFLCARISKIVVEGQNGRVLLKDHTGEIEGTIDRQLLEDFPDAFNPDSVIIFHQVGVFSPNPCNHYLIVTTSNVTCGFCLKNDLVKHFRFSEEEFHLSDKLHSIMNEIQQHSSSADEWDSIIQDMTEDDMTEYLT